MSKNNNEDVKSAMEFAYAMGLKMPAKGNAFEEKTDMEFAYAMGLRHDFGFFKSRKKSAGKVREPEVSFSFS